MATKKDKSKKYIENIILNGSKEEKKELYKFNSKMSVKEIAKRFNCFVVGNFIRYYEDKPAEFHAGMIEHYIRAYLGDENFLNIGFRGSAKTTLLKLVMVYVLLNDERISRKYIKVITKDTINSKQIVTDVYNLVVELTDLYGDLFEKTGKTKKEESMTTFTLKTGVKLGSGTVGQVQRGQVQDAYRPDFLWFEDIEDSSTIRSMVQTQNIISKIDEAIQGMSDNGNYIVTANYISEEGTVEWFKQKKGITTLITPIVVDGIPTWDKYTIEKIELLKDDSEDWEGDYLCDPTSGKDKFFDIELAKKYLAECEEPTEEIDAVDGTKIKLWEEYRIYHHYGVGGDTAEGIGRDSNAMTLFNFDTNTVIGTYHSSDIAPDMFGYEMVKVGRAYGECILAPERNNTGFATISAIKQSGYWNIYQEVTKDLLTEKETEKLGWGTDRKTKPTMWFDFRKDFNCGIIRVKSKELLEEIIKYTKADFNDRTTGVITRHFDLLTSCFVKGTSILTEKGQKPIENLKVGDKVLTREGYKPIIATMCSLKSVIKNISLTGTKDHPIFCNDNSIKYLSSVDDDDILYIWNQQKIERLSFTEAQRTIDTQTQNECNTGFTMQAVQSGKNPLYIFIEKFGWIISEIYLKVLLYTTKTAIKTTTRLKTLKCFQQANTQDYTAKAKKEKSSCETILLRTEINSTKESEGFTKIKLRQKQFANGVVKSLHMFLTTLSSVLRNVLEEAKERKERNRLKNIYAQFAGKNSKPECHIKKDVPQNATKLGEEKVYNIQVKDCPEYFANNILVHNCVIGYQMKSRAMMQEEDTSGGYVFKQENYE